MFRNIWRLLEEFVDVHVWDIGDLMKDFVRVFVPNSAQVLLWLSMQHRVEQNDNWSEIHQLVSGIVLIGIIPASHVSHTQ